MECLVDNRLSTYVNINDNNIIFNKEVQLFLYDTSYQLVYVQFSKDFRLPTDDKIILLIWRYDDCHYGNIYIGGEHGS